MDTESFCSFAQDEKWEVSERQRRKEGRKAGRGWVVFKKCSQRGHGNQENNTWLPPLAPPPSTSSLLFLSIHFTTWRHQWCQPVYLPQITSPDCPVSSFIKSGIATVGECFSWKMLVKQDMTTLKTNTSVESWESFDSHTFSSPALFKSVSWFYANICSAAVFPFGNFFWLDKEKLWEKNKRVNLSQQRWCSWHQSRLSDGTASCAQLECLSAPVVCADFIFSVQRQGGQVEPGLCFWTANRWRNGRCFTN